MSYPLPKGLTLIFRLGDGHPDVPFLNGGHLNAGACFDDFAVGLHVKQLAVNERLAHRAQERLGDTFVADRNFLNSFGGGGCGFQIGLEHRRPTFGQKRNQVLACGDREYERDCRTA